MFEDVAVEKRRSLDTGYFGQDQPGRSGGSRQNGIADDRRQRTGADHLAPLQDDAQWQLRQRLESRGNDRRRDICNRRDRGFGKRSSRADNAAQRHQQQEIGGKAALMPQPGFEFLPHRLIDVGVDPLLMFGIADAGHFRGHDGVWEGL